LIVPIEPLRLLTPTPRGRIVPPQGKQAERLLEHPYYPGKVAGSLQPLATQANQASCCTWCRSSHGTCQSHGRDLPPTVSCVCRPDISRYKAMERLLVLQFFCDGLAHVFREWHSGMRDRAVQRVHCSQYATPFFVRGLPLDSSNTILAHVVSRDPCLLLAVVLLEPFVVHGFPHSTCVYWP